jgi:hypothetical protein
MTSWTLPPPPSSNKVDSPEWRKWFYLLTQFSKTVVGGVTPIDSGGTGKTTVGTANQLLGVDNSATALEYKSLVAGSGISLVNGVGSITVTSLSQAVNNVITVPTTIAVDTSYVLVSYLTIQSDFINYGNVMIIG